MQLDRNQRKSQPDDPMPTDELLSAVLASDLAQEVASEFTASRETGCSVPSATANVFGKFRAALVSPQDGPVVLVALAALQLRESNLQAVIREAAIDLLDSGEALNAYRSADFSQRKLVREMLDQLRQLLDQTSLQADE